MLKTSLMSAVAALSLASFAQAQVQAPREVNQEQGRGAQEKQVEERAGNRVIDRTGVINGARRDAANPNNANTTNRVNPGQPGVVVGERGDHAQILNGQLADCILLHNQEEINLAKFAMEHSQNQKVKDFAQKLITDHQAFGDKLQQFAHHHNQRTTDAAAAPLTSQNERPAAAPVVTQTRDGERTEVRVGFAGNQKSTDETWYQIEKQSVQNCEQMTRDMLSKEKGAEFDKCFIGSQIGAHMGMIAHLKAAQQHVSGDFQQVLQDGLQHSQQHLDQAEALKGELMANQK
ncbi:DUF4142 domain-containing protein [Planctomicrobium sp. SH661]|uniref:DUF4142 domain-containing protein n=1 Tax=Planctomicrobium sp. SH661 TaxID=3448124 RepID=UPI003F5B3513